MVHLPTEISFTAIWRISLTRLRRNLRVFKKTCSLSVGLLSSVDWKSPNCTTRLYLSSTSEKFCKSGYSTSWSAIDSWFRARLTMTFLRISNPSLTTSISVRLSTHPQHNKRLLKLSCSCSPIQPTKAASTMTNLVCICTTLSKRSILTTTFCRLRELLRKCVRCAIQRGKCRFSVWWTDWCSHKETLSSILDMAISLLAS